MSEFLHKLSHWSVKTSSLDRAGQQFTPFHRRETEAQKNYLTRIIKWRARNRNQVFWPQAPCSSYDTMVTQRNMKQADVLILSFAGQLGKNSVDLGFQARLEGSSRIPGFVGQGTPLRAVGGPPAQPPGGLPQESGEKLSV